MATKKSKKQAQKSSRTEAARKTRSKSRAVAAGTEATQSPTKPARSTRPSALNAAAHILADSAEPLNCQEMIAVMAQKGLWTSPAGKTPAATLYAAILKEIRTKGSESRFLKVSRGKFAHT